MTREQTGGRWTNICRDGEASHVLALRGRGTLHTIREGGVGRGRRSVGTFGGIAVRHDVAVAFVISLDLKM